MPQRREPHKQERQAGMHLTCRLQLLQDLLGKGPLVVEPQKSPQLPAPQTATPSTVRLALSVSACRTFTLMCGCCGRARVRPSVQLSTHKSR